jgi:hypothetical protein
VRQEFAATHVLSMVHSQDLEAPKRLRRSHRVFQPNTPSLQSLEAVIDCSECTLERESLQVLAWINPPALEHYHPWIFHNCMTLPMKHRFIDEDTARGSSLRAPIDDSVNNEARQEDLDVSVG